MKAHNDNSGLFNGPAAGGGCYYGEVLLLEAFQRRDFKAVETMIYSKEYSDNAIANALEDVRKKKIFPQDFLNAKLTEAANSDKMRMIALWMHLGADIHHSNEQPLQAAILGQSRNAVDFLRYKGCEVSEGLIETVRRAAEMQGKRKLHDVNRFVGRYVDGCVAGVPSLVPQI